MSELEYKKKKKLKEKENEIFLLSEETKIIFHVKGESVCLLLHMIVCTFVCMNVLLLVRTSSQGKT